MLQLDTSSLLFANVMVLHRGSHIVKLLLLLYFVCVVVAMVA